MTDQSKMTALPDGTIEWRLPNGELHRRGGPAFVRPNGAEAWWQHGELHRDYGPAITHSDGTQAWYQNGKLHRVDGPAVAYSDGTREWWINGAQVTEFEHAVVARAHALAEQGRPNTMPQS